MKYSLRTEHVSLNTADEEQINKQLRTLSIHRKLPDITDISFHKSTPHGKGNIISCIINIQQGKRLLHTERDGETLQNALAQSIEVLRRKLQKNHDEQQRHDGGVQK